MHGTRVRSNYLVTRVDFPIFNVFVFRYKIGYKEEKLNEYIQSH